MDVRLPDGTIIQNVPDGITKAELTAKLKANGYDVSKLDQPAAPAEKPNEIPGPRQEPSLIDRAAGSVVGRLAIGAATPVVGALQLGANIGDWINTQTGVKPVVGPALAKWWQEVQQAKERGMNPVEARLGGPDTTDIAGMLGSAISVVASPTSAATVAQRILQGAREGAALGVAQPGTTSLQDQALSGAIGGVVGGVVPSVTSGVTALRGLPEKKAAKIARETLGTEADAVLNALRNAPLGVTPAQATAGINAPAWQALLERSGVRTPASTQYISNVLAQQEAARVNELARLAGGATATETRGVTEAMKETLTDITSPARQAALTRANLGQQVADFEAQAGKLSAQAAAKVQEVRRLIDLGDHAAAAARLETIKAGVPAGSRVAPAKAQPGFSDTWAAKYTYPGKLAQMSDDWASKAAEASLDLGQGAQFAQSAANSMRSAGIKPLKGDEIIGSIRSIANNPEFAGNDLLLGAVKNVADDIAKWSNSGGIIDAKALDAIRKNSINAAIQQLRPGIDATTQRNLTAEVMGRLKPALIDAIEAAGGKGYRAYLEEYAQGMQQIAQKKLTGEALRLYKDSPDQFVKLVRGESPDVVEKFLGPRNYNIAKELSDDIMGSLKGVAGELERNKAVTKQASEGRDALRTVLEANVSKFKIPWGLSPKAAAVNKGLDVLETKLGAKVMSRLTEASKTAQSAEELLSALPAADRSKVLAAIRQFGVNVPKGTSAAVINALAPKPENALTEQ
ncbi:hypothetical protein UFOVP254_23 [uncultured Caudovirales phage]|uniref:Uncharacterized protein n=1 Tax=uncultured Caudovirales phage TaxID=2100421 RepID=A0A6J5LFL0_9CAUD|nr:hypothetical protein UFOVP76_30 [uncultured Caudovirales phage]CAB4132971.1 hypothetical protein UFOVP254_23 [uncultured Caudovirales phage]